MRPQTYEDVAEAEFLNGLYLSRDKTAVNTVFCVLEPDGKSRLTRAARSPLQQFSDPAAFATFLNKTFEPYAGEAKPIAALPVVDSLALGINVASCDSAPLVVLRAENQDELAGLEAKVTALAWAPEHLARQHFVVLSADAEIPEGLELEPGLNVLESGAFGLTAKLLAHAPADADATELAAALELGRAAHDPAPKEQREHTRNARKLGIEWESEIPVPDSGSKRQKRK